MLLELVLGSVMSIQASSLGGAGLQQYVDPSGSIRLSSGEPMQVTCRGDGGPTAILLAGSGGWSIKWASLHDDLAQVTRACTVDRPGWGMAGIGRGLTPMDMVEDYREALNLAGEEGPFVLMGHSQGGTEAVTWADNFGSDVAALILLDPGMPNFAEQMFNNAPLFFGEMRTAMQRAIDYFNDCAEKIEIAQTSQGIGSPKHCMPRAEDVGVADALASVAMSPGRFRYSAEEMIHFTDPDSDRGGYSGDLGDLPVVILQATVRKPPRGLSEEARAQSSVFDALLEAHHSLLTTFSSRAQLRPIPRASHDILADRPDTIIEALREIVASVRDIDPLNEMSSGPNAPPFPPNRAPRP